MFALDDIKTKGTSDILKQWLLNSPSGGFRRIGRAKTLAARIIWIYIVWIFTIFMITFTFKIIINYTSHPTKIHLNIRQYRNPDHFPAITFCNVNPLQDDGFLNDVKKSRLRPSNDSTSVVNKSEYRLAFSNYIDRILSEQVNTQTHPFVQWGFKLNDLLITCVFNKRECSRNLTQLFHPNYGNCYTFDNTQHVQLSDNNDTEGYSNIKDNLEEKNYKLFLELFLHQSEYNRYLEQRAAFRIFIHRKNQVPILSESSLFLRPNRFTELKFSQRIMSLSQNCRNELTDYMKQIFVKHSVRYTQGLCYKLCEQRFIEKTCHCIQPTLAVFYQFFHYNIDQMKKSHNISLCSIDDKCLSVRGHFDLKEACQECLPECEIMQYSVQSSYANYPNRNAYGKVSQRVRNHFTRIPKINSYLNKSDGPSLRHGLEIKDNIVAVEISDSPFAEEILTETAMYTWVDVISSIGGQASLWIGISLINFFEIVDLLYLLFNNFYSYLISQLKIKLTK